MAIGCICRSFKFDDDDIEEDEEAGEIADESLWYREDKPKTKSHEIYPIDEAFLDTIRKQRLKEVAMW